MLHIGVFLIKLLRYRTLTKLSEYSFPHDTQYLGLWTFRSVPYSQNQKLTQAYLNPDADKDPIADPGPGFWWPKI